MSTKNIIFMVLIFSTIGCNKLDKIMGLEKPKPPIVILVAGQSNGVSGAQEHELKYSVTGAVSCYHADYWQELKVPTKENPSFANVSFIYMGDLIVSNYNREVHIINICKGGTSSREWIDNFLGGFVEDVKTYKPDAILWIQGETDKWLIGAKHQTKEWSYSNLLYIKQQLNTNIPFYVAITWIPEVHKRFINEGHGRLGVDLDNMRSTNANWFEKCMGEVVGEGLKVHGERWFNILSRDGIFN